MISKQKVCQVIDAAAAKIERCWDALAQLRGQGKSAGYEVKNLQTTLIAVLWSLDDIHRELHTERRRLIAKKSRYSQTWFKGRMATLSKYQDAVLHTISLAKTVGDGFAWIFYHKEFKLIDEHLKSQRQIHLPPRIGRIGERAFVERFQVFNDKLVLYHGITTFLRMDDVSFFDFAEHRITNIGEIKTEHVQGDEYLIRLAFVYGGKFASVVDVPEFHTQPKPKTEIETAQDIKLARQLSIISKFLSGDKKQDKYKASQHGVFYFDELNRLIGDSSRKSMRTRKAGDGLLLVALRMPKSQLLSRKLLSSKKFEVGKKLDGMAAVTSSILDQKSPDNALVVSELGVSSKGVVGFLRGTVPLYWWPLKFDDLKDIAFSNVIILTLYNPAHFWRRLRKKGFQLTIGERARITTIKKPVRGRWAAIYNFDYLQSFITHYLMSEDSVIEMLERAIDISVPLEGGTRIDLSPQLRL